MPTYIDKKGCLCVRDFGHKKEKKPPNKEVANVCAKCGSYLKWWVTCWRCRNLDCRAEYPHNAEL